MHSDMFRNSRENGGNKSRTSYKPSIGRPPTPPSFTSSGDPLKSITTSSTMASSPMPLLGRSRTLPRSTGRINGAPVTTNGKSKGKPNGSILSFFKKTEPSATSNGNGGGNGTSENADSLFFGGETSYESFSRLRSPTTDDLYDDPLGPFEQSPTDSKTFGQDSEGSRYHEQGASVKRRKIHSVSPEGERGGMSGSIGLTKIHHRTELSSLAQDGVVTPKEEGCTPPPVDFIEPVSSSTEHQPTFSTDKLTGTDPCTRVMSEDVALKDKRRIGPFIEDSDSDEDMVDSLIDSGGTRVLDLEAGKSPSMMAAGQHKAEQNDRNGPELDLPKVPVLKQESTSVGSDDDFDGIEDFADDEFPEEGEEYIERRWIEEQRRLELGLEDEAHGDLAEKLMEGAAGDEPCVQTGGAASCPICTVDLSGITDAV